MVEEELEGLFAVFPGGRFGGAEGGEGPDDAAEDYGEAGVGEWDVLILRHWQLSRGRRGLTMYSPLKSAAPA